MKVYLIRHGQSEANAKMQLAGTYDAPLTERGREQARAVAEKLRDVAFSAIYCSDLQRARDTAQTIAAGRDIEVTIRSGLRERHFGDWEGRNYLEIQKEEPDTWMTYFSLDEDAIPGAEKRADLHRRVADEYRAILSRHDLDSEESICIVAHGCVLQTLFSEIVYGDRSGYFRFAVDNAAVNMIEYVMNYAVIHTVNG